jgi:hypothetical protein
VNDLTALSDDELRARYLQRQQQAAPAAPDLSRMSDDELKALYAQRRPSQPAPQVGQGEAALRGLAQGASLNFADEAMGLAAASPIPGAGPAGTTLPRFNAVDAIAGGARLLGEKAGLWGSGGAQKAYDDTVKAERDRNKIARDENPWTYGASEFAGGMALPLGAAGQGVKGMAKTGAGVKGMAKTGAGVKGMAKTGAGVGAVAGYGSGEGAADSAVGAGVGAGIGGAVGAALPRLARGVGAVANATGIPALVRGFRNPTGAAEREVAEAFAKDARVPTPRLDAADMQAARNDFQPVVVGDMGGEAVRDLARTANNLSSEAGAKLKNVTQSRYEAQSERFRNFSDDLYGGPGSLNNTQLTDDIAAAAKKVNTPAYRAANEAAENVTLWDDELANLARSPSVYRAMQEVEERAADRMAREGEVPIRNPFTRDADGNLQWKIQEDGSAVMPNLTYWDHVKRNLDREIGLAKRAGDDRYRDLVGLKDRLTTHLDNLIPEYGKARAGAAVFFGADDMLKAGQEFINQNKSINITDAAKALRQATPEERAAFERGFVTELMQKTQGNDRANVPNIFNNAAMREKIGMVMGDQRAMALESFVRRETIMNYLRDKVQGNSTTMKQAAGAGALLGGGLGSGGDLNYGSISVGAILGTISATGRLKIKEKVAREIADILTSSDPARISQILAKSEEPGRVLQGLRSFEKAITRGAAARSGAGVSSALPSPVAEDSVAEDRTTLTIPRLSSGGRVSLVEDLEDMIRKRITGEDSERPFEGYAEGGEGRRSRPPRPPSSSHYKNGSWF